MNLVNNKIKVTVIMPVYNSETYIQQSVLSVMNQSISDWELILVDDCSSDRSVDIVKSFEKNDARIKLIQLSVNSGAAVARNAAILAAKGRYIAFLDSDDLWKPNKLERQIAFMQANNVAFSYAAYEKIDETGISLGVVGVPPKTAYRSLLKTCVIGCLTAVYDTHYFGKVTMPLIHKRQDFGLWLKLLKRVEFSYGINEVLGQYRVRNNSISANKFSAAQYTWRLYRKVEKLSLPIAGYYFIQYSVRGFLRSKYPLLARRLRILN